MRIGINCLGVDADYVGGVTTYSLGLIDGILTSRKDESIVLFVHAQNRHLFERFRNREGCELVDLAGGYSFWRRVIRRLS